MDAGEPNEALFALLEKNTRLPVKILGDIRAQVAGCTVAEHALAGLFSRYGIDTLRIYFEEMRNYAERVMRSVIAEIPDGSYEFTDFIDGLGEEPVPIRFHVRVTVDGDEMEVDWTGTSEQVKAGINAPFPYTKAATYLAARLLVTQDIPNCDGYMRPLHTIAPQGTIVNPLEPAGCATRGITGCRALETIMGALPRPSPIGSPQPRAGITTGPRSAAATTGEPFVYVESIMGTWGGRPNRDGSEGVPHPAGNQPNQPVEVVEARNPLQVTQYRLIEDTGGPGKYRGGLSLLRELRVLADEAGADNPHGSSRSSPVRVAGRSSGTPAWNILNPDGPKSEILPTLPMEAVALRRGDVLRIVTAGGGGWGDPLEREPDRVLADVRDEKLTVGYAERHYGVVIDPQSLQLDAEATSLARERFRRDRI